ncbi:carboxypeptidase N subunit 2 [Tribolium castaneum]|uniref:Leucine-rich repeats and immunoglobulin-like domains protein 3 n=1 Tax=Tribolium castaneum TaxID=7070 RepID=D2A3A2_TRICA|nr:PREDICTED: carboxypeptidase N subunit 2 [Tribolium castaneum]EFA02284.1 Leucine-rich repeats and immunoglobulin-like domains protein 3 [Tribolium castaneum]|eukprot:XP_008191910.2 PREDICTED: carboxypeptidase N subunit 2 [Tribolium castaneum]
MTICDSFEDFKNYTDIENLSNLMIGSESGNTTKSSVNLMKVLHLGDYYKLTNLYVINAISSLELTVAFQCTFTNSPLQYVTFYGNLMPNIEAYHFPVFGMKKFTLVNNQIETIKDGAFKYHDIENMDLSDNLMENIEAGALPQSSQTKIITIRNNKLTHIEVGSFPSTLESLNLDWNKFRLIQEEVFANVLNLKELTLSHNNFNQIPKINFLTQLVIFDISFNAISTIPSNVFKDMTKLKLLDLSNNDIKSPVLLQQLQIPVNQEVIISLGLNRLRSLNLTGVSLEGKTLVLYGNPWDCDIWPELKGELSGHESECDLKFLSSGNVPFCINYRSGSYAFVALWENDIDRFHQTVRKSEKNSGCVLRPARNLWLYDIQVGCVA